MPYVSIPALPAFLSALFVLGQRIHNLTISCNKHRPTKGVCIEPYPFIRLPFIGYEWYLQCLCLLDDLRLILNLSTGSDY